MVTIDYGDGACVSLEAGGSVLEASRQGGIAHADACGGRGLCTTCRVRVESGLEHCPAPDEAERQALAINGLPPGVRLACQLRPTGDIAVRVLIREHAMPSGAAPEAVLEQVAVLFVDIRGFTGFAEKQLPFDVSNVLNRYFDGGGEARPARARVVLLLGAKQRQLTAHAAVQALVLRVVVDPGEGGLGAGLAGDLELLRGQLLPPLLFALLDALGHVRPPAAKYTAAVV